MPPWRPGNWAMRQRPPGEMSPWLASASRPPCKPARKPREALPRDFRRDEYYILDALTKRAKLQAVISKDGKSFDRIECEAKDLAMV